MSPRPGNTKALARFLAACLAVLGTTEVPSASRAHAADEGRAWVARRKALFIEQFTRLIEWPQASLPADGRFVVCIQGASDTANELSAMARVRRFKDRSCDVRPLKLGVDPRGCHVIYVASGEAARLPQLLTSLGTGAVLVVGDTPGFVQRGVHLNLFEETRTAPRPGIYVNYELNVMAVRRSVLTFHPQLLSQGRTVSAPPTMSPAP